MRVAPGPHAGCFFLTQSAESLENKRVEFLVTAKKCKRVRKSVKRRGIARKQAGTTEGAPLPLCFCKRLMRQGLEGGVGKRVEGKGLRGIVRQTESGQVGGRKDLSRIHFSEHGTE